jgi:hypothetical protein
VMTAATTNVTNARSEGMNSKIQWIKRMACGYRNRKRFHNQFAPNLPNTQIATYRPPYMGWRAKDRRLPERRRL